MGSLSVLRILNYLDLDAFGESKYLLRVSTWPFLEKSWIMASRLGVALLKLQLSLAYSMGISPIYVDSKGIMRTDNTKACKILNHLWLFVVILSILYSFTVFQTLLKNSSSYGFLRIAFQGYLCDMYICSLFNLLAIQQNKFSLPQLYNAMNESARGCIWCKFLQNCNFTVIARYSIIYSNWVVFFVSFDF